MYIQSPVSLCAHCLQQILAVSMLPKSFHVFQLGMHHFIPLLSEPLLQNADALLHLNLMSTSSASHVKPFAHDRVGEEYSAGVFCLCAALYCVAMSCVSLLSHAD